MRPEFTWSMSTVGLTAQEISFPIENPFLRGSYCHTMAGPKSSWSHLNNVYFSMDSSHTGHSPQIQHKGPPPPYERHKHSPQANRLPPKPSHLSLSLTAEPSTPSPADDQVVPSFQKLSMHECNSPTHTVDRGSKPLPPIPLHKNIFPEQTVDIEVEFFPSTDENCLLVSDKYSKSSFFRCGSTRRSCRDSGRINPAYCDNSVEPESHKKTHMQQHQAHHPAQEVREYYEAQHHQQRRERPEPAPCQRQQEKNQRKLRRSHSGPAGSLNKPSLLRLNCHKRHTHIMDKPEVPPPVPPRVKTSDYRRWSAEVSSEACSDEDKPPKVPPREPLSRGGSPKSLPSYTNGVMPPTQSFAPDPNYARCRALLRQNSDCTPCILPVMEDGRQVSNTHYYLVDRSAAYSKTVPEWDSHTRRKVDLV